MTNNSEFIYDELMKLYPEASCELIYHNPFELLIAVVLSAQTTDIAVNKITKKLFARYPDAQTMSQASITDVENIIKTIGLYHNKAKNIISLSKTITNEYQGKVPDSYDDLTKLAGVGRKSTNVILAECFNYQTIAVDTHVNRIAKRLQIAQEKDSVITVEEKLKKYFNKEKWTKVHHLFIFFGRYKCKAKKPECVNCPFTNICNPQLR